MAPGFPVIGALTGAVSMGGLGAQATKRRRGGEDGEQDDSELA